MNYLRRSDMHLPHAPVALLIENSFFLAKVFFHSPDRNWVQREIYKLSYVKDLYLSWFM